MRDIIIATGTLGGGGAERVFLNLANEMSEQGMRVHVLVTSTRKVQSYPLSQSIILDSCTSEKKNKAVKIIDKFVQIHRYLKNHPDSAVISFFPDVSAYCVFASVGCHVRTIVSERNDPRSIPEKKVMRKIRDAAFSRADVCVFQTQDAMNYFPEKVRKKGYIIGNPIRAEDFPSPRAIRERDKIILAVGRIVPQKNFLLLLKAWEKIEKKYPDYVVQIYGNQNSHGGIYTEELQQYIEGHNLQGRIELMGFSNDIYSVMNRAAIYVSPSNFEGMSNTMLEAMAMGLPSIVTDCPVGGARSVIESGRNGILVPIQDVDALASAMDELLQNESMREQFSQESVQIRKTLSIHRIAQEWIHLIQE